MLFIFEKWGWRRVSRRFCKIKWRCLIFNGSFSFVLDAKLRALKPNLNQWNRELFGYYARKLATFWIM